MSLETEELNGVESSEFCSYRIMARKELGGEKKT
jgi:hypothetical protein